jgi:hypothetical protein
MTGTYQAPILAIAGIALLGAVCIAAATHLLSGHESGQGSAP